MTPLVAILVVVLLGVIVVNVVGRARAGVRSVRSHHRALDTLGHIATQPLAARDREPGAPAAVHQAHVRILWPEPEVPVPSPVELAEQLHAASVAAAAAFRLPTPPPQERWGVHPVSGPGVEADGAQVEADGAQVEADGAQANTNGHALPPGLEPDHEAASSVGAPVPDHLRLPAHHSDDGPAEDGWPDQILPKGNWPDEIHVEGDWPNHILLHDGRDGVAPGAPDDDEVLAPTGRNLGLPAEIEAALLAATGADVVELDRGRVAGLRGLWRRAVAAFVVRDLSAPTRDPAGGDGTSGGADRVPPLAARSPADADLEPFGTELPGTEPAEPEMAATEPTEPAESAEPVLAGTEPAEPELAALEPARPDASPSDETAPEPVGPLDASPTLPGSPASSGRRHALRSAGLRHRSHRRRPSRRVVAAAVAPILVVALIAAALTADRSPHRTAAPRAVSPPATPRPRKTAAPPTTAGIPVKLIANSPGTSLYQLAGRAQITFTATGLCWVEIRRTDANGPLVWYATMTAGTTESVTGPIWARLGNPTAVAVSVGDATVSPPLISGQPYNLQFE